MHGQAIRGGLAGPLRDSARASGLGHRAFIKLQHRPFRRCCISAAGGENKTLTAFAVDPPGAHPSRNSISVCGGNLML